MSLSRKKSDKIPDDNQLREKFKDIITNKDTVAISEGDFSKLKIKECLVRGMEIIRKKPSK